MGVDVACVTHKYFPCGDIRAGVGERGIDILENSVMAVFGLPWNVVSGDAVETGPLRSTVSWRPGGTEAPCLGAPAEARWAQLL